MKRKAIECLVPILFLISWSPLLAADTPPERPNIVFILADDLGWADLGCYGADLHETPNLDRLAASALRFTHACTPAPVCTPTRASIMCGKHPARLHMTIWREAASDQPTDRRLLPPTAEADLPHAERTIAEVLRDAGYLTAHVGKWHLGSVEHFPETQGFDVHLAGNHWGAPATHFFPYRGRGHGAIRYVPGLGFGKPNEYLADRLTDEAIAIMRQAGDRPFFLNLWHYGVHAPIEAKSGDIELMRAKARPELHHQNIPYAAMVKNLDDTVGRLLAALDELGIADRTLVVFSSDNGGFLGPTGREPDRPVTSNYPLRSGKGSLYEGGIRVPLIVRWPGVTQAGAVCEIPVVSTDLYRTLAEVAGTVPRLDAAQQTDGRSLKRLLLDSNAPPEARTLFWHYPHYYPTTTPASALRDGDWKLIEYLEDGRVELYDLAEDPSEAHDLAKSEASKAAELRDKLHAWRTDIGAQMPSVNSAARQSN
ncbi:MAG: sulfatase [Pirellulales bacterium]|nr:sulfatase [Pirellulales bacterium]